MNKKTLAGIAVGLAVTTVGVIELQVPASEPMDNYINSVEMAELHLKYLTERAQYIETNGPAIGIPQRVIDSVTPEKEKFEDYLLRKKYIDNKGEKLKEPPKGIIDPLMEQLSQIELVKKAYAFVFGKEDFESCGALPCSFTGSAVSGAGTSLTLDATSKVNGTDSVKCTVGAAASNCNLYHSSSLGTDGYIQYYIFIPTGWTFGASSYMGMMETREGGGGTVGNYCNLEDYGTVRITCNGTELGYTDTGIDIALNDPTKIEIRFKISATVGDLDIWKDSNVQGSPTYNGSGTLNTGVDAITRFDIFGYKPDVVNDHFFDDVFSNTSFIGDGVEASTPSSDNVIQGKVIIQGGANFE